MRIDTARYPMQMTPVTGTKWLPRVSLAYLLVAGIGATIAIREGLPAAFAGHLTGQTALKDFLFGPGTALSPGVPLLTAQAFGTALSGRGERVGAVGAAILALIGAGETAGLLGEPIFYQALAPRTFDPQKAPLVTALVALPVTMTALGVRQLFRAGKGSRRRGT
jgi:hypothetical protein